MKINFLPYWISVLHVHLTTKITDWVERNKHTVYTTPGIHKCEHFHQEFSKSRGYNSSAIPVTSLASMNWLFYFSSLTGSKYFDNYKSVVLLLKNWHAYGHQQNVYQILNLILACMLVKRENSHKNIVAISYMTILQKIKITMTLNKVLTISYDSKYGLIKKSCMFYYSVIHDSRRKFPSFNSLFSYSMLQRYSIHPPPLYIQYIYETH